MSSLRRSAGGAAVVLAAMAGLGCRAGADGQGLAPAWVEHFGGGTARPAGVAVDAVGDIVVAGGFQGSLGVNGHELSAAPTGGLFVARVEESGAALWADLWPSPAEAHGVALDPSGNTLLTGHAGATPAPVDAPSDGYFVAKIDTNGRTLWQTALGAAMGRFNLRSGGAGFAMMSARTAPGLYVEMVGPAGDVCWDLLFPIACGSAMAGVASNPSASLAVTGFHDCPVDFGGGPLAGDGRDRLFVASFDAAGNYLFSLSAAAVGGDVAGRAVAMDDAGDVFVAGGYAGALDLGGDPLPASKAGMFVAGWSPAGALLWSRGWDGAAPSASNALALDAAGNVYVLGSAASSVDVGDGASSGAFILELTKAGAFVSAWHAHGEEIGAGFSGGVIGAGGAHVAFAGAMAGTVDFGGDKLTSAGSSDLALGALPLPTVAKPAR
jgi:hypothetical protein